MKQTIFIYGMTCSSCEAKIKEVFENNFFATNVEVSKESGKVTFEKDGFISNEEIEKYLKGTKYSLNPKDSLSEGPKENKSFLETYKPLFILFGYILLLSIGGAYIYGNGIEGFMRYFMAGFFLSFSYFKLINLKEFSNSYSMYDIVAKRFKSWGYLYAFLELLLGILYFIGFNILLTSIFTFALMSISLVGVVQTVMKKQKIKCACLGAVFDLPMSHITIIEDALMIIMALFIIISSL